MPLTVAERSAAALSIGGRLAYASLHTADPATTGASEVSGGSPAYARKAITFTDPEVDGTATTAEVSFDIPAGTTVTHFGTWSAATAGTFRGGNALAASQAFSSQGILKVTITLPVSAT